jgi:hypothetical protein
MKCRRREASAGTTGLIGGYVPNEYTGPVAVLFAIVLLTIFQ